MSGNMGARTDPQPGPVNTIRAVILAAGRGTRMQREVPGLVLDPEQLQMAERGLKGLIPFHGHPFLAYVMSALADAGIREVCLVIGPGPNPVREHFERAETKRLRIDFAVQDEPLGSAHALLSAEPFAAGEPFLLINADNYYPGPLLARMQQLRESGMAGFLREPLVASSNIPADRVAAYALVTTDADGHMTGIVEKPGPDEIRRLEGRSWISMTLWRFRPGIFDACRAVSPSVRGELELPDAVGLAVREMGERFRVIPVDDPVLDLSRREDIASVGEFLRGVHVEL